MMTCHLLAAARCRPATTYATYDEAASRLENETAVGACNWNAADEIVHQLRLARHLRWPPACEDRLGVGVKRCMLLIVGLSASLVPVVLLINGAASTTGRWL